MGILDSLLLGVVGVSAREGVREALMAIVSREHRQKASALGR